MLFQFHKGTIKTYGLYHNVHNQADFNSIKVRLKRFMPELIAKSIGNFNSIKVRLKLTMAMTSQKATEISIP